jgi:hypothetical protein
MVGITEGDATRRTFASIVSANYFQTMNGHLAAGRSFTPEEERTGSQTLVAVVSYPYWQKRGGGADVIGRRVRVNARDFEIIGVTGKDFTGSMVLHARCFLPLGLPDGGEDCSGGQGAPVWTIGGRRSCSSAGCAQAHGRQRAATRTARAAARGRIRRPTEQTSSSAAPRMGLSTEPGGDGGSSRCWDCFRRWRAGADHRLPQPGQRCARRHRQRPPAALGSSRRRIVRRCSSGPALSLVAAPPADRSSLGINLLIPVAGAIPFGIDVVVATQPDAGFAHPRTAIASARLRPLARSAWRTDVVPS